MNSDVERYPNDSGWSHVGVFVVGEALGAYWDGMVGGSFDD